ncbi:MAG TPA: ornithine cyclodeaminase family protein [Herpetosiphonaceae bacterium]|nr:ornithine cyclodeaminase family protein [Herpetosiphonaceae bacterium]
MVNNTRRRLHIAEATLMSMEAGDREAGLLGHKNYLAVPGRPVLSHFFLYDSERGDLQAMMQANELGRIRTGATSAVAARYLARADASRHAVFGAGFQAETQVLAISQVRPVEEICVWSRSHARAEAFCDRIREHLPGILVEPAADDPAALACWGEIITLATRASQPVLQGAWLTPGAFVNAIGSNAAERREVGVDVVRRADVIVADSLEGARLEAGDLIAAADAGALDWARVSALSNVVAGTVTSRETDRQVTLFESQRLALEDLAVADYIYRHARTAGVGRQVDLR